MMFQVSVYQIGKLRELSMSPTRRPTLAMRAHLSLEELLQGPKGPNGVTRDRRMLTQPSKRTHDYETLLVLYPCSMDQAQQVNP